MQQAKRSHKRFYTWIAIAIGICALGVPVAAWRLRLVGTQAREELARVLSEATGAHASVREATLNLTSWTLVARGIELDDQGRSLLHDAELQARPSLLSLVRGRLQLHSLQLSASNAQLNKADLQRLRRGESTRDGMFSAVHARIDRIDLDLTPFGSVTLAKAQLDVSSGQFDLRSAQASGGRADQRITGSLQLNGQLSTQADATHASGQLRLESPHVAGHDLTQPIALTWQLDRERLTLAGTLAFEADGALGYAITFSPDAESPLTIRLQPKGLRAQRALEAFANARSMRSGTDALLDGEIELHGTLTPLSLRGPLQLTLRELRIGDPTTLTIPQLKAAAQAQLGTGGLTLDALQLMLPSGTLAGTAHVDSAGPVNAALTATELALRDLSPIGGIALAGHGRVELQAHGAWTTPELHCALTLEAAAVAQLELGKLQAELDWGPDHVLSIKRADSVDRDRHFSTEGARLRFDSGLAEAHAHVKVTKLPLTELYRALGAAEDSPLQRLQGDSSGDAELSFTRTANQHPLQLTLNLHLGEVALAGYRFDRGQLRARIDLPDAAGGLSGGVLTLEQLTLGAGDGTLELAGDMRRGVLAMHVALHALPLAREPWLHTHFPSLAGRLDGKGELSGDSTTARADIGLVLDNLRLVDATLGRVQLRALLRNRNAAAQLTAADTTCTQGKAALTTAAFASEPASSTAWLICGEGMHDHLHVDLALGNSAEHPIHGSLAVDDFALAAFLPTSDSGAPVPGALTAALQISAGSLSHPERISGELQVQSLKLGTGETALASSAPFSLHIESGALSLKDALLRGPEQAFQLSAAGTLANAGRLIADGHVDASVFTHASAPLVDAFGDLNMHLEWSPGTQPSISGRANLHDVTIRINTNTLIRNITGEIQLTTGQLHLAELRTDFGRGQLQLDGQVALRGLHIASYALSLTAAHVKIEPQEHVELLVDTDSHLDWSGGDALPRWTGHVLLKRALYARPLQLAEAMAAIGSRGQANSNRTGRERLQIDLEVAHEQPLRVRNSFLDGELVVGGPERKLHIVGSDQQLGLAGQLSITRGRVLFYGDEFRVTHGEIAFNDTHRIAPTFDISAVANKPKRPDTSIVFRAHGSRDTFDIGVHCETTSHDSEPPPFSCDYAHDHMRCDTMEQLGALWQCRTNPKLSRADNTTR